MPPFSDRTLATSIAPSPALEDALEYLPSTRSMHCEKGQIIYRRDQRPDRLYLVLNGHVKLSRFTADQRQIVLDVYVHDEFFGEASLIDGPWPSEEATALTRSTLMAWTRPKIDALIARKPRLGIALVQTMSGRSMAFARRIESLSAENNVRRLARWLLYFCWKVGTTEGALVRLPPLTHQFLAQCVGTSREIVNGLMAEFRRQGYLSYSRKGISISATALADWLKSCSSVEL